MSRHALREISLKRKCSDKYHSIPPTLGAQSSAVVTPRLCSARYEWLSGWDQTGSSTVSLELPTNTLVTAWTGSNTMCCPLPSGEGLAHHSSSLHPFMGGSCASVWCLCCCVARLWLESVSYYLKIITSLPPILQMSGSNKSQTWQWAANPNPSLEMSSEKPMGVITVNIFETSWCFENLLSKMWRYDELSLWTLRDFAQLLLELQSALENCSYILCQSFTKQIFMS